jgi:hypothetical protein
MADGTSAGADGFPKYKHERFECGFDRALRKRCGLRIEAGFQPASGPARRQRYKFLALVEAA